MGVGRGDTAVGEVERIQRDVLTVGMAMMTMREGNY